MPFQAESTSQGVVITHPQDGAQLQSGVTLDVQSRFAISGNASAASLLVNDQPFRRDVFNEPLPSGNIYQPWAPPGQGTYVLQVIIEDSGGMVVPSASITVYVSGEVIITATPAAIDKTETPTLTSTITFTPIPEDPQVTANQNVNCRRGPSTAYSEVGALLQGQTALVTGRNQDNSWYYIDLNGTQCWVWSGAVTATSNVNEQPLVPAPPLPITVTPSATSPPPPAYSACHDYPDIATCNSDPMNFGGCSWNTGTNQCQP
jgi:hypothetical protein